MLRSVSDIISSAWELYIRDFKKFLPLITLVFLPQPVLTILGLSGLYLNQVTLIFNSLVNILILIALPVLGVLYLWATLASIKVAYNSYHNRLTTSREALKSTIKKILPAIFTVGIVLILIFFGTLLLFIPGIIFLVWYAFVSNVVVIEEKNLLSALSFSKNLVVGRFFEVAWRLLIPWVSFVVVGTLLQAGLSILIALVVNNEAVRTIIENNLTSILSAFVIPLTILANVIVYEDLKTAPLANK